MRNKITNFLFSFLLIFFLRAPTLTAADKDLIKNTCRKTKDFKFCFSFLKSDPFSDIADTKGLASILLKYGVAAAVNVSTPPSSAVGGSPARVEATRTCGEKYVYAKEAMEAGLRELKEDMFENMEINLMAAGEYADGCRRAFVVKNEAYPGFFSEVEIKVKKVCSVVEEIVEQLL